VGDGCGGTGGGVQFHVGEGASSVEFLQHTLLFLSIKKTFMVYYLAGWSVLAILYFFRSFLFFEQPQSAAVASRPSLYQLSHPIPLNTR
jgi:hypothetical protein